MAAPSYRVLDLHSWRLTTPAKLIGPARNIGGNQSGRTRRALYWRLRVPGHADRWAQCLTDPWHVYASVPR